MKKRYYYYNSLSSLIAKIDKLAPINSGLFKLRLALFVEACNYNKTERFKLKGKPTYRLVIETNH